MESECREVGVVEKLGGQYMTGVGQLEELSGAKLVGCSSPLAHRVA